MSLSPKIGDRTMALVVNTNVASLNAQRQLNSTTNSMATAMERLSSGQRINSAADDAAGLSIASRMTSQVKGLSMAIRNANDGISLAQTAEGAMEEVSSMLQRMRELSVQASNSINTDADRQSLNDEVQQLKAEIERIATTTKFNNKSILDGSLNTDIQIGDQVGQTMGLAISSIATAQIGETADGPATDATSASLTLGGVSTAAADYAGKTFDVTVNGVVSTVTLPANTSTSVPATAATVTAAITATDRVEAPTSTQIGAYSERTIDVSTNTSLYISVNDGDTGHYEVNVSEAATALGHTTTALTGSEFVESLQKAINDSSYFTGDNAVTVSLNDNGSVQFEVAGGAQKIAVSGAQNGSASGATALLAALDGARAGSGSDADAATTTNSYVATGTALALNPDTADATETFGLENFVVEDGVNDVLELTIGDSQKVSVTLTDDTAGSEAIDRDLVFDGMEELASHIQSEIDATGLLVGDNAVTVSATVDSDGNHGVTITNAAGQKMVIGGTFVTATTTPDTAAPAVTIDAYDVDGTAVAVANAVNAVTSLTQSGGAGAAPETGAQTIQPNSYLPQIGAFAERTLDLNSGVQDSAANSVDMGTFSLNVNGGGDIVIDLDTGLTAPSASVTGSALYRAGVDTTTKLGAVTGQQMVDAMQLAIDDSGFFVGDNAVTVSLSASGNIQFDVAGGAGTIEVKEAVSGDDGLVRVLSGTNGGVEGAARETSATGALELGAAYNAQVVASSQTPAGSISIDLSATTIASGDVVELDLIDDQGNVVTIATDTDSNSHGSTTITSFADLLTSLEAEAAGQLAVDADSEADKYTFTQSAGVFTITHADGHDFQVRFGDNTAIAHADGLVATADNLNSDPMHVDGTFVSSQQLVSVFGEGANRLVNGSNDTISIQIESTTAIQVDLVDTTTEYQSIAELVGIVQAKLDAHPAFVGDNRITVGSQTNDDGDLGLTFQHAGGKAFTVAGNFVTAELEGSSTTYQAKVNPTGGVDLSSDNTLSFSLVDTDNGSNISRSVTLGSADANVSHADYASLVATAVNNSLAADGYSVTVSSNAGNLEFTLDQAGAKTITLSGTSMTALTGGSISAAGTSEVVTNSALSSMDDVISEINADLTGAEASFDAVTGQLTFAVTDGSTGVASEISVSGADLAAVQIAGTLAATGSAGNATASKLSEIDVLSVNNASEAIASIDNALEFVNAERSNLGAIQNRLEHTVNNLSNIVENTSASRSRIQDADFAAEAANLAKYQVMQQAGTAMLAQANAASQVVLSLLG